jgi:hypothetical protein
MKKSLVAVVFAVAVIFCFTTISFAKDVQITKEIKQITFKKDKNGNEYARIIINEPRTVNGISFNKDVMVMAFGDQAKAVKGYKKGSTLNVIAAETEYKGSTNYNVLSVIK